MTTRRGLLGSTGSLPGVGRRNSTSGNINPASAITTTKRCQRKPIPHLLLAHRTDRDPEIHPRVRRPRRDELQRADALARLEVHEAHERGVHAVAVGLVI